MPRRVVFLLSIVVGTLAPAVSLAADENCPDGWFCDPNAVPQPPQPPQPPQSPQSASPTPASPPATLGTSGSLPAAPGYGPAAAPALADPVQPSNQSASKRRQRGYREWGLNLHLEAALLGRESEQIESGMGGLGFAFRYRPLPPLALEAGIDFLKGTDPQGYARKEASFLLDALLFFNPRDVVQVYALAGLSFSGANVTIAPRADDTYFKRHDEHYGYFGGQLGLGVEVRVSRLLAVGGDLIGFIRGRTDDHSGDEPQFINGGTQRVDDRIGGGLLRAGVTFYW